MSVIKVSTIAEFRNQRESNMGDCAVRAFAVFMDVDYSIAFSWINKFNHKDPRFGTNEKALFKAMVEFGKIRGIKITRNTTFRGRVAKLVKTNIKALILARGHASACQNGVHYGNLNQHEADNKMYRDDANQNVKTYYTMEIVDTNLYLSGNVC